MTRDATPREILSWEQAPPSSTYSGPDGWKRWLPVVEELTAHPGQEAKIMVDSENACASLVGRIRQQTRPWKVVGGIIVAKRRRVWMDEAHTVAEHRVYAAFEPVEKETS